MRDFTFSIETEINSTKEILWQHITQMKNVNAELYPFARMTFPKTKGELGNNTVLLQQVIFKSVILLFSLIPIDLHYLRFDKLEYGSAFYENSYSLQHYYWKHTRTLKQNNGKTTVHDDIHFSPRISFTGYILLPVYKLIFKNRHKNLASIFSKTQLHLFVTFRQ